ncbi:23S rRNA (guanosine(2251)-2'-O)-methyltransferase RlmB [Protofrankia symbiont of Coriaria ruscifolia]|uniref:23S rRNA (guanosine(2251)-2'-O)-methyltransferase RlmB n=1 Tax=Protofrankia symbiont of Coriaria ruscifolia TaxID=1306542 RepID=UPI0010419D58|nr:23S rRNA (guanosine(2251)-2'-O)-methyltransferase RlmB [Protofrankia symbiont of Coriaria ruscifolia]
MAGQSRRGGNGVARGGQGGRAAKAGSHRKGASAGSGGQRRKSLQGRGATPPAEMRPGHPAQRRAAAATAGEARRPSGPRAADKNGQRDDRTRDDRGRDDRARGARTRDDRATGDIGARGPRAPQRSRTGGPAWAGPARAGRSGRAERDERGELDELVVGRNAVVEALRAGVPASVLYIAAGTEYDERLDEARRLAPRGGVAVADVARTELDRICGSAPHQGLALSIPPFQYAHPDDLLARAQGAPPGLLVALDGVTDPRNLGAVIRSAAAFGAHGVMVPERRAAGVTAAAWKTSAGAAARLPVARATNLVRALTSWAQAGLFVVGLAADGEISLDDLEMTSDPLALVVGSEGRGLSRLVGEHCDLTVRIPMLGEVESLNAGVATGVVLAEIARRRRVDGAGSASRG